MISQRDRLKYLTEKIKTLNYEVVNHGLQEKYAEMVKQISDGCLEFKPVYADEWELMLPIEQQEHLLAYYHTLRSELQMLKDELKQQGSLEKASAWLDNSWVKRGVTLAAIVKVAIDVGLLIAHSGLFFQEDDQEEVI